MRGAIIFNTPCDLKNAYQIDINSAYAYIMSSSSFKIPMKEGEFQKIDILPEILTYGIYLCIITLSGNEKIDRYFRLSVDNMYTHIDIYCARLLNLKIELIINDQSNCLLYGAGKCVQGSKMFKTIVDKLYKLKSEKVAFSKLMLLKLWGSLCEKNKIYGLAVTEDFSIPSDCYVSQIHPYKNGLKVSYYKKSSVYKLNYARFAPFLTSAVRYKIIRDCLPYNEHIFKVNTDSILSDIPLTHLKIGTALGEYKIEHEGSCIIKNNRKPVWY
jgi:hypothetical protein